MSHKSYSDSSAARESKFDLLPSKFRKKVEKSAFVSLFLCFVACIQGIVLVYCEWFVVFKYYGWLIVSNMSDNSSLYAWSWVSWSLWMLCDDLNGLYLCLMSLLHLLQQGSPFIIEKHEFLKHFVWIMVVQFWHSSITWLI